MVKNKEMSNYKAVLHWTSHINNNSSTLCVAAGVRGLQVRRLCVRVMWDKVEMEFTAILQNKANPTRTFADTQSNHITLEIMHFTTVTVYLPPKTAAVSLLCPGQIC